MNAAIIALALATLADIWTTEKAIQSGATEANPVIRWMMDRFGRGWIVAKIGVAVASAALLYVAGADWAIWIMAAITGAAAMRNWRIMK